MLTDAYKLMKSPQVISPCTLGSFKVRRCSQTKPIGQKTRVSLVITDFNLELAQEYRGTIVLCWIVTKRAKSTSNQGGTPQGSKLPTSQNKSSFIMHRIMIITTTKEKVALG
jgi:hypothetical protein